MALVSRHTGVRFAAVCAAFMALGCGFAGGDGEDEAEPAAPTAVSLPAVDPCTLVTAQDAAPYVPGDYHQNRFSTSGGLSARGQTCTYMEYANAISDSEVVVLVSDDPFTADDMKTRADKWIRKQGDTIDPLPGIGDQAYVVTSKDFGEVWVLLGNRALALHVTDKDGQFLKDPTIEMARKAASRFPRS